VRRYNGKVKRGLFAMLSAMSLLLCGAVAVLWVRSYVVSDEFYLERPIAERQSDARSAIECR
jgi:hypothetical protein